MTGDLPDYTRTFTVNISLADNLRIFASKAEAVAKKVAYGVAGEILTLTLAAPAAGKKTGLILIVFSSDGSAATLKLESLQSGSWVTVWDKILVAAVDSRILPLPCFVPTQDVGDGATQTVRLTLTGSCGSNEGMMVIYYDEEFV